MRPQIGTVCNHGVPRRSVRRRDEMTAEVRRMQAGRQALREGEGQRGEPESRGSEAKGFISTCIFESSSAGIFLDSRERLSKHS